MSDKSVSRINLLENEEEEIVKSETGTEDISNVFFFFKYCKESNCKRSRLQQFSFNYRKHE